MISSWMMMASPSPKRRAKGSQDTQMRKCWCFCRRRGIYLLFPLQSLIKMFMQKTVNTKQNGTHWKTKPSPPTEPSRRLRRFLVATLTLLTLTPMLMTRVRRMMMIKMKRAGTDPRSKLRGGWGGKAFLRSTSQVSSKVVTWLTRTMRSAPQTCPRGSRCVLGVHLLNVYLLLFEAAFLTACFVPRSCELFLLNLLRMMSWKRKQSGSSDMAFPLLQSQCR